MRKIQAILFPAISLLVVVSCSPTVKTDSSQDYYEDLSILRPVFSNDEFGTDNLAEPPENPPSPDIERVEVADITYKLDSLLDSVALYNRKKRLILGYTIQVYTGSSSVEANEIKTMVYRILPGLTPRVTYDLPNYKVKVGKFYHRLQALKDFSEVKRNYPNAILVPQQFSFE